MAVDFRDLMPWEFSPTVFIVTAAALGAYGRGLLRGSAGSGRGRGALAWRATAYFAGVSAMYAVMQTHIDYLAQHLFWIHRVQHLVLHHVGPFLIALSAPADTLALGTPRWIARGARPLLTHRLVRAAYRRVQQPFAAGVLFVGLIYFWLTPAVHFYAMVSSPIYQAMNWSMAVDGLLFWWLVLGPDSAAQPARPGYPMRMAMLVAVAIPQALLGAYLTFRQAPLYDVYSLCGRAWSVSPALDQQLGGLNTWIPPGMMSALGLIILASRWMRAEAPPRPARGAIGNEIA